jgi:hypothetical protein
MHEALETGDSYNSALKHPNLKNAYFETEGDFYTVTKFKFGEVELI